MLLDFEKYMPHLDNLDVSQEHKIEIMKTVWGMMESHVDQVFGFHPVQLVSQKAEVIPLHSLTQKPNSKVTTVSKHFESASKDAANDNEHEPEEKTG